ncbi:unnamed protein product [marine sediment metagenome]|uniref:Uncharacterized protein n=1 Tax=marine sediment metagenome TaxID=412755 RepID=X1QY58_9ZZZZ
MMANIEELKKSLAEIKKSLEETNKVAKELLWNLETLTRYTSKRNEVHRDKIKEDE